MKRALEVLRGGLVVSCQAPEGDPFREPSLIARFARAGMEGGAAGLRVNGAADIGAVREALLEAPVIGICKRKMADGAPMITASFADAEALVRAGATMVALDCTGRGQEHGAFERLRRIRAELGVPVLADIATVEEAEAAQEAGADAVLSTLRGYTAETEHVRVFEPSFIGALARRLEIPVMAEGRIHTPEEAAAAISAGAFAVVVGTAITRPKETTRAFAAAIGGARRPAGPVAAIDMGGTFTKSGLVSPAGTLLYHTQRPTPAREGREALLAHLLETGKALLEHSVGTGGAATALGVATAGWVDPRSGRVVYATDTLPGWTGAPIAGYLSEELKVPVYVENDANALAIAEQRFGAGQTMRDFVCVTLGTGVGGGCVIEGRLRRGAHYFGNAIGHIVVDRKGPECVCGQRGCVEMFANAAALLRYAGPGFETPQEVVAAAQRGDEPARSAMRTLALYLARACAGMVNLLDPEGIILAGGPAQNNPMLAAAVAEALAPLVPVWPQRKLRVLASTLGYHAGVLGAAALALPEPPWP